MTIDDYKNYLNWHVEGKKSGTTSRAGKASQATAGKRSTKK
jgi:hypothetical protein